MSTTLRADYLVIGAGAVGMAFTDTLLSESDATVIMVDRQHKPGGHWNMAYPFVTLHQPSQFYGVESLELGNGLKDEVGLNKGLFGLATGAQVCGYYEQLMQHRFLPSGRVQYFAMCDADVNGEFTSLVSGEQYKVEVTKKVIDAAYYMPSIPSTHTPNFKVDDDVHFITPNALAHLAKPADGYVVLGGGKTAIDTCLWLLQNGVSPEAIRWFMPRDGWFLDRRNAQPTDEFFQYSIGNIATQMKAIAQAESIEDMFDRLEAGGYFLRLDPQVRPSMFHAATISQAELTELRKIRDVIRLGRVRHLRANEIELAKGSVPTSPEQVHIDCTASAISLRPSKPIFEHNLITPQLVRAYQPTFSASFIAFIEASDRSEAEKNQLCGVLPVPDKDTDFIRFTAAGMMNQYLWSQTDDVKPWLKSNRLDGFTQLMSGVPKDDEARQAILKTLRDNAMPAMAKLQQFMKELG